MLLLPEDTNAVVIMVATGTGIAPFRTFWRRMWVAAAARRELPCRAVCVAGGCSGCGSLRCALKSVRAGGQSVRAGGAIGSSRRGC